MCCFILHLAGRQQDVLSATEKSRHNMLVVYQITKQTKPAENAEQQAERCSIQYQHHPLGQDIVTVYAEHWCVWSHLPFFVLI